MATRSDADTFWGFVRLYLSIQRSYPVPVRCVDYGLTHEQRRWAERHLAACSFQEPSDAPDATTDGASDPFGRMLWIAPNSLVLRDLVSLFTALDAGPIRAACDGRGSRPSSEARPTEILLGWDPGRDGHTLRHILDSSPSAGGDLTPLAVSHWLESSSGRDIAEVVEPGATEDPLASTQAAFDQLRAKYSEASIVCWSHPSATTVPHPTTSDSQALETIAQTIPGARHRPTNDRSVQSRIRLISHVGCRSHPHLITHFIDHYARLGVDDFLVVLHGEPGDPRLEAAREALAAGGVVPVLETGVFSTPLKLERTNELMASRCTDVDWIVSADVDELQVFSTPLPALLERCDAEGYVMVRGQFVDRFAERGELAPMRSGASLWEQFPWGGSVTAQVTGGWPLKVCAIRGHLRFGDGGSHSLDYGGDAFRNYAATHRDPAALPDYAQIHHFKWEQGLLGRTRDKTKGLGGDREAIDGADFMHEYHALLAHVELHGRLRVENARWIGEPPLHYVRESRLNP